MSIDKRKSNCNQIYFSNIGQSTDYISFSTKLNIWKDFSTCKKGSVIDAIMNFESKVKSIKDVLYLYKEHLEKCITFEV